MRWLSFLIACLLFKSTWAQTDSLVLDLQAYLSVIKKYHPLILQGDLLVQQGEAGLTEARGNFDPTIGASYDRKYYLGKDYFSIYNSELKIPAWYGVTFKTGYDNISGIYTNPERNVPQNGLAYAGVQADLLSNLYINKKMAMLQKAKIYLSISETDRALLVNNLIFDALEAYLIWSRDFQVYQARQRAFLLAAERFNGVKSAAIIGELPKIDTLDAYNQMLQRQIDLNDASTAFINATLLLNQFLWKENWESYSIDTTVKPGTVDWSGYLDAQPRMVADSAWLQSHPLIRQYQLKLNILDIDRKMAIQQLMPNLTASYNFLSRPIGDETVSAFSFNNYKLGLGFSMPLSFTTGRGAFRQVKLQIKAAELNLLQKQRETYLKFAASVQDHYNFLRQVGLQRSIAQNAFRLLEAENERFFLGESNLFTVNARENTWVNAEIKLIETNVKAVVTYYKARLIQNNMSN
ncbi:MAG: TolC family protein [Chitinophagales bacterium]|nr:TolC family protein [Chitinophagales bacterium]